jgi:hypothetical protein
MQTSYLTLGDATAAPDLTGAATIAAAATSMVNLRLSPDLIEKERGAVLGEMRMYNDMPSDQHYNALMAAAFARHVLASSDGTSVCKCAAPMVPMAMPTSPSITTPPPWLIRPELASHTRFFSLSTAKQLSLTCCISMRLISNWAGSLSFSQI